MLKIGYNGIKIFEIDFRVFYSEVLEQVQKVVFLVVIVFDC